MQKLWKASFGMDASQRNRGYVILSAAIFLGVFAFLQGLLNLAEAANLSTQLTISIRKWLLDLFGDSKWFLEGLLLITLSFAMWALALDRIRQTLLSNKQTESYIAGRKKVSLQMEALGRHALISESDADGRFQSANEKWLKVFEYSLAEIVGQRVSILHDTGGPSTDFERIFERARMGEVVSLQQRLKTKSGKTRITDTTIVPKFGKDGDFQGAIAARTDVTDARLAENDQFLTSMLKGLREELYVYSAEDSRILFMNDRALNRLCWSLKEAKTKKIHDTSAIFDITIFNDHVAPLLNGASKEVSIQARQEALYMEISTTLQSSQDGTPIFVSLLRDITDAKLEEKRRMKNVSNVSHELRSPMTSIKGSLRLLNSGTAGALGDDAQRLVDIADRNSDRMLRVLNDILDFEKMVAEKTEYSKTCMNVTDLVKEAAEINDGYAREHDVEFLVGETIGTAHVIADAGRLMQVLTNLLSNAAKFSPEQGRVEIAMSDQGKSWRVSVTDNGPGIPEEDYDKVFKSFTQLDPVDGKTRKGTGLGLAISAKIIAAHNGTLEFNSEVGKGTTFYFDLPKAQAEETSEKNSATSAA